MAWALVFQCGFLVRFVNDLGGGMVEFVMRGTKQSAVVIFSVVFHAASVTSFA